MPTFLCFRIEFLQPYCHGRRGDGAPEWPPAPLRLYQALVAAAAARWNERMHVQSAAPALRWLENQSPPTMVAVAGSPANASYRLYVPDNVADKVAKSWSGGREATIADYRTEKDVRPTRLSGGVVHYLYPLTDGVCPHLEVLSLAARSITHLGWGIDMVVGDAMLLQEEDLAHLPGERWLPVAAHSSEGLRVPCPGTLDDLIARHRGFLHRLHGDHFQPVSPLSIFRVFAYRRAGDPVPRAYTAFSILKPDASGFRAFDTPRRTRDVAGWIRNATGRVCTGWPFGSIAQFVHGHDENQRQLKGPNADQRFMYLPLPTINHALHRVELVRRVMITAPAEFQDRIDWVRRRLAGAELITCEEQVVGLLNLLPTSDWVLRQYTGVGQTWSTVIPVVWPGHDDRKGSKAERILRRAFEQAGLAPEVVAGIEELEWRAVGFREGLELATRYVKPANLQGPTYHVRVRFAQPVQGPLAVGAGRYRGWGLFAREE